MAIIRQGILGGVSGRIASVIGTSWKGRAVLRSRPLSVANPRTTAQVNQRNRFKTLSDIGGQLLSSIVKPLNDRFSGNISGFNSFISRNRNAFNPSNELAPLSISISRGQMNAPVMLPADWIGQNVTIKWDATITDAFANANDRVFLAIIGTNVNGNTGTFGYSDIAVRSDGQFTLFNPKFENVAWKDVAWHLAFLRQDGTVVSNSIAFIPS